MGDELSQRVLAERERRGWSQRQAAERAGINSALWSRIESGKAEISNRSRARIAQAFDWPLDWPDRPVEEVREISRLDAIEDRLADLEAFVRAMMRAMVDDRERAAIAQEVASAQSEGHAPLRKS